MSKWLNYASWNKRNEKMSTLWILDLVQWLDNNIKQKNTKNLFDYGCSYFDLGEALAPKFKEVYGYDPDQYAIEKAKLKQIRNASLFSKLGEVQTEDFDVIVASSVLQYFENIEAVEKFFFFASCKLKKNSQSILLISDIIPKNYTPSVDALENLIFAILNGVTLPMIKHLIKAASAGPEYQLLKINKDEISKIAAQYGLKVNFLNKNLTPSKRRYSCTCELL